MVNNHIQTIGPYRVIERIGMGGMATVYKAYHPKLDRVVAIKMIHQSFLEEAGFIARFEREAQIVALLEHPHIVPVYDFAEHNGLPYLVMKLIDGRTLKQMIGEGQLPWDDQMRIMTIIASALDYAHAKGVLHRDIKPSNIMIDTQGTPYLTDFGLARTVQGGASTLSQNVLIGTPFYMSPELARGDADVDARSDVYSFGIVLYELLTGRVPYQSGTPYTILQQHISALLPRPRAINPDISPALEAVLIHALAKDRDERPPSAGALMAEVRRSAASAPVAASPPHPVSIAPAEQAPTRDARVLRASPASKSSIGAYGQRAGGATVPAPQVRNPARAQMAPKRRGSGVRWWIAATVVLAILLLMALSVIGRLRNVITQAATQTTFATLDPDPYAPLALFTIPIMDVATAQTFVTTSPNDPVAYLSLFRALLIEGRTDEVEALLEAGLRVTNEDARFLLSAAHEAADVAHPGVALAILREGLGNLQADDPGYPAFRAAAGQALYSAARLPDSLSVYDLQDARAFAPRDFRDTSPIYLSMVARALLEHDRRIAGNVALRTVLERAPGLAEALLVEGEFLAAEGESARARTQWRALLATPDIPPWVRERSVELLGEG